MNKDACAGNGCALGVRAIESWMNTARVAQLYNALKTTSNGSSFEVAQLEVVLMLLEHPDMMN